MSIRLTAALLSEEVLTKTGSSITTACVTCVIKNCNVILWSEKTCHGSNKQTVNVAWTFFKEIAAPVQHLSPNYSRLENLQNLHTTSAEFWHFTYTLGNFELLIIDKPAHLDAVSALDTVFQLRHATLVWLNVAMAGCVYIFLRKENRKYQNFGK